MQSERSKRAVKCILKGALVLGIVCLLSLITEILVFNRTALSGSYDALEYGPEDMVAETTDTLAQLSAEEQRAIEVEQENKRLLAEYYGEEYVEELDESLVEQDGIYYQKVKETRIQLELGDTYYIKKLKVSLPLEENAGYTVRVYEDGTPGEGIYCSRYDKLKRTS